MATHEEKRAEAQLHDSDVEFGTPLDIGEGYSVAFHSATCRYCSYLPTYTKGRGFVGNLWDNLRLFYYEHDLSWRGRHGQ